MSGRHVKLMKIIVVIIWIGTIFAYLGWWIGFSTAFGMLCISILGLCHSAAFILLIFRGILIYRNM